MIGILYRNEGRLSPNSLKSFVQALPLFKRNGLIMRTMDNEKRGGIRVDMCQRTCQSHQLSALLDGPSHQLSDGARNRSIIDHLATLRHGVDQGTGLHYGL